MHFGLSFSMSCFCFFLMLFRLKCFSISTPYHNTFMSQFKYFRKTFPDHYS